MFKMYVSAFRKDATAQANLFAHVQATSELASMLGLPSRSVVGVYNGEQELSLLLAVPTLHAARQVTTLMCDGYEQECVLLVTHNDVCYFVDSSLTIGEPVGKLKRWTLEDGAAPAGDYTWDGEAYYTIEEF